MSPEVLAGPTKLYKNKPWSWGATQTLPPSNQTLGAADELSQENVCRSWTRPWVPRPTPHKTSCSGDPCSPLCCGWTRASAPSQLVGECCSKCRHESRVPCNSFVCVGLLPNSGTAGLDCSYKLNFLRNCHAVSIMTIHPTNYV